MWILQKQETVRGSGISWAICKSAPRSKQITTPATDHSVLTSTSSNHSSYPESVISQLSFLLSAGCEMSTGQRAVTLCGQETMAGNWGKFIPLVWQENASISQPPHPDMSTRSRHSVISDSSDVRAVHHDQLRQVRLPLLGSSCLEIATQDSGWLCHFVDF